MYKPLPDRLTIKKSPIEGLGLYATKKIEAKKIELKELYNSPKETITVDKFQKWGVIQLVKVFLGIPVVPGK